MVNRLPAMQETWVRSQGWKDPMEKENGNPFQYSCLENLMDGGAWQATVHGVAESQAQLSNFTYIYIYKTIIIYIYIYKTIIISEWWDHGFLLLLKFQYDRH